MYIFIRSQNHKNFCEFDVTVVETANFYTVGYELLAPAWLTRAVHIHFEPCSFFSMGYVEAIA